MLQVDLSEIAEYCRLKGKEIVFSGSLVESRPVDIDALRSQVLSSTKSLSPLAVAAEQHALDNGGGPF